MGHPSLHDAGVPEELAEVVHKHCTWTHEQISAYRRDWCKKWLQRAKDLEAEEKRLLKLRPQHVQKATAGKRILVTAEILNSLNYEDMGVLDLLTDGSTLAGVVPKVLFSNRSSSLV